MPSTLEDLRLDGLSLNGGGGATVINYVTNPTFGGGAITPWAQNNVTGSASVVGGKARQVSPGTNAAEGLFADFNAPPGTYQPSVEITAITGSGQLQIAAFALNGGGTVISSFGMNVSIGVSPARYVLSTPLIAPAGTTKIRIAIYTQSASANTFDIDQVSTQPTYFDGDMPGYYWTGTAHNSTSISSPFMLEQVTMPPPAKRPEWQQGADSDGAALGRTPLYDNRTVTARVRVNQQADMDTALACVGQLLDKLQEADRNTSTGISLQWTPAGSTKTTTFTVLSAQITDMPISTDGDGYGWFVKAPVVTIELTCRPFGFGAETVLAAASSTLPVITTEITGVPGDVPALGRLIVTDNAAQTRRHVEWGAESLYYPTTSPPGLLLDSDSLITSGYAGTGATRTGAYDPGSAGNSVVRGTLATQPTAVCGIGDQTHVGTFRVKARVWAAAANLDQVQIRFAWQDGDGPFRANRYVTPPVANAWAEIDLGVITTTTAVAGSQRWTGRVEAYSTSIGDTVDIDYLLLIPAEAGYGIARSAYAYQTGTLAGRDEFTGTTAGDSLNGRAAPIGGTWATSGAATDFVFTDSDAQLASEGVSRSTTADTGIGRVAVLGATNYTNTEVSISYYPPASVPGGAGQYIEFGVLARYVDSSNYFRFALTGLTPTLTKTVAGVTTAVGTFAVIPKTLLPGSVARSLRVVVFASGAGVATIFDANGVQIAQVLFADAALATGGALASGKPGFSDFSNVALAASRHYDNFYAGVPPAEPMTVFSSQSIEFRHDSTLREDATGTTYGTPPSYRGARFLVPPAGTRNRKTRIAVKARRNDIAVNADDHIADSTTVQIAYTPRFLAVPRT